MSDEPGDEAAERTAQAKRRAQGSAADLRRMGIDPRSLGLGDPEPPVERVRPVRDQGGADVVPLRPQAHPSWPPPEPVVQPGLRAEQPAEQALRRTAESGRARRTPPLQSVREVAAAAVSPAAAEAAASERDVIAMVRQRQTDRRIVGFLAGKGGVGCTTVALAVGVTLATLRDDHTALLDLQQGAPSLGALAGVPEPHGALELAAAREVVSVPSTPAGLGVVDGAGWDERLGRRDVAALLDRLGTGPAFKLLDLGNDPGEGAHTGLARADRVVVVTSAGAHGLAALRVALDRLEMVNPTAARDAVPVVVCSTEDAWAVARRELVGTATPAGPPITVLPPDGFLATGQVYDPAAVGPALRDAVIRVAALVAAR